MLEKTKLEEFKRLLLEELEEIEERNKTKVEEMEHNEDTEKFHGDEADQANFLEMRNRALRLRDRDRKMINKITATLEKIDRGTYGVCEVCGIDIPEERLRMRPVASLCIECKREQEEKEERDRAVRRR